MRLSLGEDWPVAAVFAAAAIMIAPLWCVDSPAMPDYPAHLASFWLIAGGAAHSPYYSVHWAPLPNLAFEALVPLLAPTLTLSGAIKLLLSLAVIMWVVAPTFIQRAISGRFGLAPLGSVFFTYNDNFVWGFFNYYFAAGLALVALACWLGDPARRKLWHILAYALATFLIYFCHIFGAVLFLLFVGCDELADLIRARRFDARALLERALPPAAIAAPTLIAFFLKPSGPSSPIIFNLADSFRDRVEAAIAVSFDQPGYIAIAVLFGFFFLGLWRGWIRIHPRMRLLLVVLFLLTFLLPEEAMGGWGVDLRLPAVLGALLFASITIVLPARARIVLAAAALVAVALNAAALAGNWRYYDAEFHEFRAALKEVPRGVKLMTVLDGDAIGEASDQPYWHIAEFAVIDRNGFTPLLFTTRGQHVIWTTPALEKISARTAEEGSPPDVSELDDLAAGTPDGDTDILYVFPYLMHFQCHYDEAVLIHLNGKRSPVSDVLRLKHAGSFFSLYDIDHEGCR